MRKLTVLGIVLIGLGIAGLAVDHFSYTKEEPVLDAGPIHVKAEQEHHVSIPMVGAIVVLVAGVALVLIDRRAA